MRDSQGLFPIEVCVFFNCQDVYLIFVGGPEVKKYEAQGVNRKIIL
jgi:hypothetical protein